MSTFKYRRARGNGKFITPIASIGVVLLASCSGRPGRVDPPLYAPDTGAAAVSRYDADSDGAIAGDELDAAPGLKAAIKQVDADGDGRLTAEEIDARVQVWRNSRVAEMPVGCRVLLDGQPLLGAKLEFVPESFLGSSVKPAFATTGDGGESSLSMAAENLADQRYPGVNCGWYTIRVTSDERQLPPRYNTETTLGCEIASDAAWVSESGVVLLELTSR